jgi:predicted membrane protein
VPITHTPDVSQRSTPLHRSPSSHDAPAIALTGTHRPVAGSQVFTLHAALVGVHTTGVPAAHVPVALQVSAPLHALPSEHAVPAIAGVVAHPVAGSHASTVQGLLSLHVRAAPAAHAPVALQVSAPLQALPSEHAVPAVAGVLEQPVVAPHASTVQGLPSSHERAVPAAHAPVALQVSAPLQALPSEHAVPAVAGVVAHPVAGSHASTVQGLLSLHESAVPAAHAPAALHVSAPLQALPSEHAVPAVAGVLVQPVAGLHASLVHALLSLHESAVPAAHTPVALQVSAPLQALPSEHAMPALTGVCEQPPVGAQASAVQGLLSSHESAVPAVHTPAALHVSAPLQTLLSAHAAPAETGGKSHPDAGLHPSTVHALPSAQVRGAAVTHTPEPHTWRPEHTLVLPQLTPSPTKPTTQPVAGLQLLVVQGLLSAHTSAVPAVQAPAALQVSAPLQRSPSEHAVPAAAGGATQPIAGSHASTVQGLLSLHARAAPAAHAPAPSQASAPLQALPSEHATPAARGAQALRSQRAQAPPPQSVSGPQVAPASLKSVALSSRSASAALRLYTRAVVEITGAGVRPR